MRFMQTSKLFTLLPEELVCTPDGMAIDRDGNLILSCPNFADLSMPSCVLKIDKDRNIKKWFDVPRNEYTGEARAMGIEFGPDGDLYLVDNAGWTGEPHMVFTGRILRLRLNDAGVVKCTVVADNMEHPNGIRIWGDVTVLVIVRLQVLTVMVNVVSLETLSYVPVCVGETVHVTL